MDEKKTTNSNTSAVASRTPSKTLNSRGGLGIKTNTPSRKFNFSANRTNNDKILTKSPNLRSKSNLTGNINRNTGGLKSNALLNV